MRKSIVTVLAVAIIGALGLYGKNSQSSAHPVQSPATQTVNQTQSSGSTSNSAFKDGTFKGNAVDTPYGIVQIAVIVSGGKISDVNFLQMPSDLGHSQEVTAFASPILKQETIQTQSANIDFVSGATSTSEGYQQSLQSALNQTATTSSAAQSTSGSTTTQSTPSQSVPSGGFYGEGE